jgi:acyl carrier protein
MSATNTEERVRQMVADQLHLDLAKVEKASSFIDDLGADSLDIVELVMTMEEEFDVQIPDEDGEKIKTVGDAISYINGKKGATA